MNKQEKHNAPKDVWICECLNLFEYYLCIKDEWWHNISTHPSIQQLF